MNKVSPKSEKNLVSGLFFLFGFGIMSWIPRFPEVKANLGVDNGTFGSLISVGSIGALISLMTAGHIVHKIGSKKVLVTSITVLLFSIGLIVHIRSSFYFLLCNMMIGLAVSAFHIALTGQAFHTQEKLKVHLLTKLQGLWSAGSVVTAMLSGFLVGSVSLGVHIGFVVTTAWIMMMVMISKLTPVLTKPNEEPDTDISIKKIFSSFRIDWPIAIALSCGVYMEFAVGDWGTIFTKERLGMSEGLSTVPYILFSVMMIFGRLSISHFTGKTSLFQWVKRAAIGGGTAFIACITIAVHLPSSMKNISFALFCIGFLIAGLGSSILAPTFLNAANQRSSAPSSVVVGQIGTLNTLLIFVCKWIVAWTIQITGSMAVAMMIPALMLLAVSFFAKNIVKKG